MYSRGKKKNVAVSATIRTICRLAKWSRNRLPFCSIRFLQLCAGLGSKLYTVVWELEYYWKHYLTGRVGYLTIVYIIVRHCLGGFYEELYVESQAKRRFYGP